MAARKLDPLLPAMKAHGVPWLIRHLKGEIALDEAAAGGKMDTRRYAKRQVTWFRNQMADWPSRPLGRPWTPSKPGRTSVSAARCAISALDHARKRTL